MSVVPVFGRHVVETKEPRHVYVRGGGRQEAFDERPYFWGQVHLLRVPWFYVGSYIIGGFELACKMS